MKIRFNIGSAALAALLLTGASSCTKNFDRYNTNDASLSTEQSLAILPAAYALLEQNIYHNYQTAQNLNADGYAGYFMSQTPFSAQYDLNYGLRDDWDKNGFIDQYSYIMSNVSKISQLGVPATHPDAWAVALILQVDAMNRVTDRFGPIPYSKAGTSITSVAYDSQKDVYTRFFSQLDTAVNLLTAYIAAHPGNGATFLGNNDLVYSGNNAQWLKFANSLRLRLAMRIVKADAVTAQAEGEKALGDPGGLMSMPADDAKFQQSAGRPNDVWLLASSYQDCAMNAALMTYMTGYNDPRLPAYALPATDPVAAAVTPYEGIRIGIDIKLQSDYQNFAIPNINGAFSRTAPQWLMSAAEVWFLKAEAALRGWANAGDVKTDYETGITTSFAQWGVSSGTYITDAVSTQTAYVDPKDTVNNSPALSMIKIAWDPTGSKEQQLEQVTTQKWIATYPDGQEAWANYRRTGYPQLFPVVDNQSQGKISTSVQIRRLAFPSIEYTTNGPAVQSAVSTLLGGPDNGGTRLWWDVAGKGNF
jgi:hypothetical protein